jgi:hypothetical protein
LRSADTIKLNFSPQGGLVQRNPLFTTTKGAGYALGDEVEIVRPCAKVDE